MILNKKQAIILIVSIILVFSFVAGWGIIKIVKAYKFEIENRPQPLAESNLFSFQGKVISVDANNKTLIAEITSSKRIIKLVLSKDTELTRFDYPFDPNNPPIGTAFTITETRASLSDFEVGDEISVQSKEDMAGKKEANNIDYIYLYK